MKAASMFVTDFDGTLLKTDGTFSPGDLSALQMLRDSGCAVVLASGRSPFSLWRCLGNRRLPVDWYVLSSGAGVLNSRGTVCLSHTLSAMQTREIHMAFQSLGIEDVFIQGPFPDAHRIHWIPGDHGREFNGRLELYRGHTEEIDSPEVTASEVIGFTGPGGAESVIGKLSDQLGEDYSVIRATSPIDHRTVWIEVFPRGVHKGSGCEFIRNELGIHEERTAAVGNDWNDTHMLNWACFPFVVENAPDALLRKYPSVPSNDHGGVAAAAAKWLERVS